MKIHAREENFNWRSKPITCSIKWRGKILNGNLHDGDGADAKDTKPFACPLLSPGLEAWETLGTSDISGDNRDLGPIGREYGVGALGVKAEGAIELEGEVGEVLGGILEPWYGQG